MFLEDGFYVREGLGRMINLPLLVREHCLRHTQHRWRPVGTPDPDDCKFLQQVATQIAYAIDHVLAIPANQTTQRTVADGRTSISPKR